MPCSLVSNSPPNPLRLFEIQLTIRTIDNVRQSVYCGDLIRVEDSIRHFIFFPFGGEGGVEASQVVSRESEDQST